MSGLVFIISAPSGSGKSTLVSEILKAIKDLDFSVSYTTRKPRGSEQNGREYCFVDRQQFEKMIAEHAFLEYADVFGNYYGTARHFLDDAFSKGHDLLLDIDVQGAAQVREHLSDAISIFVMPPSRRELELRLKRRSSAENVKDESVIQRRLQTASREIENYGNYGYILVNDRLEDSIEALKAIILSERRKHLPGDLTAEEREQKELAESCLLENARERVQPIVASFAHESSGVRE